MTLAVPIRDRDGPVAVGAVMRADVDLLPIYHIDIAVTDRCSLDAREIGSGRRLRQKLPTANLPPVNRWEKALLLFLGTPNANAGAAHLAAAIIVGWQSKTQPRCFLFQHDDLIEIETAAAVLLLAGGIEPAFRAESPA